MRSAIVVMMVVSSVSSASAAELVVRDARLGLDLLPLDFNYELKDSTGTKSGQDVFGSHYGLLIGGRYSLARIGESHGAVIGFDLGTTRAAYAPANGTISAYVVAGEGGYGWAVTDTLVVSAAARLGVGVARASFDGTGSFASYSPSGPVGEYGLRAGLAWAVTDQVILDGGLGWRSSVARLTADDRDLAIDSSGLLVAFGLGWRFTSSPWRLE